jgi:hypothetical protein
MASNSNRTDNDKREFSFERKRKMASKIGDIRDKATLRKIRDIIYAENNNVSAKKNDNGYLMYFQNFSDDTYYKIEKLLNKLEQDKLDRQTRSVTEMSSEDPNVNYNISRTRLRYSNREKRLIKRKQYENIISEKVTNTANNDIISTINNTIDDTVEDTNISTENNENDDNAEDNNKNNIIEEQLEKKSKRNTVMGKGKANKNKSVNESDKNKITVTTSVSEKQATKKGNKNKTSNNDSSTSSVPKKNPTIFSKVKT